MITHFHAVCGPNGYRRATKLPPMLGREEVSVRIKLEMPDTVFRNPQANVEIVLADAMETALTFPVEAGAVAPEDVDDTPD